MQTHNWTLDFEPYYNRALSESAALIYEPFKLVRIQKEEHPDRWVIYLLGQTKDDRHFFTTAILLRIDLKHVKPEGLISYIDGHLRNARLNLDTFLDPRCKCEPRPGEVEAEHCAYHKGLYGY